MMEFFKSHKKLIRGILVGLGAFILTLLLGIFGLMERMEYITWDLRISTFASPGKATEDIVIVEVDQGSLDWSNEEYGIGTLPEDSVICMLIKSEAVAIQAYQSTQLFQICYFSIVQSDINVIFETQPKQFNDDVYYGMHSKTDKEYLGSR